MEAFNQNCVVPKGDLKFLNWRRNKTDPLLVRHQKRQFLVNTDLVFLVRVYAIFGKVIGLQKLSFSGQTLTKVGNTYKFYALSFTSMIVAITLCAITHELEVLSDPISVHVTALLQFLFTMMAHIAIVLQNNLKSHPISLKIYETLGGINNVLHPNMQSNLGIFKIVVIAIHTGHLLIESALLGTFMFLWNGNILCNIACTSAYIILGEALQITVEITTITT